MHKLYQRLLQWARSGPGVPTRAVNQTVHTEVIVKRQGVTVLLEGSLATSLDICPLCGQKQSVAHAGKVQSLDQSQQPRLPEKKE